jgi:hypothetical protein
MRCGEILKLKWREVDLETKKIVILAKNSKTGKSQKGDYEDAEGVEPIGDAGSLVKRPQLNYYERRNL